MENAEIMNNQELEVLNEYEVAEMQDEETGGKGFLGIAIATVIAGVGVFLYKRSKKAEERKIEKLRKKGYVIYTPEEVEDSIKEEEIEAEYVNAEEAAND